MKLLVVDDEDVLDALHDVLEAAGFIVMPAANAEDAITKASGAAPDLLLTDLDLGAGMNGIELAAEARRCWPALPIVYISGRQWLMQGHKLDPREAFLPKPFRQRELLCHLRKVSAESAGPASPSP